MWEAQFSIKYKVKKKKLMETKVGDGQSYVPISKQFEKKDVSHNTCRRIEWVIKSVITPFLFFLCLGPNRFLVYPCMRCSPTLLALHHRGNAENQKTCELKLFDGSPHCPALLTCILMKIYQINVRKRPFMFQLCSHNVMSDTTIQKHVSYQILYSFLV